MIGRQDVNSILSSCETYDSSSNIWILVANMTSPRMGHTANVLSSGKALVTGGDLKKASSREMYNPVSDTWIPTVPMSKGHRFHTATRLAGNKLLVIGGLDNQHQYWSDAEVDSNH